MQPKRFACHMILLGVMALSAVLAAPQAVFARSDHPKHRPSPADCDAYARNYAERYAGPMLGGAVRGAAGGALFGAVIGGGKGAKRGALLGGAVGGAKRLIGREEVRRRAYDDCMAGRIRW